MSRSVVLGMLRSRSLSSALLHHDLDVLCPERAEMCGTWIIMDPNDPTSDVAVVSCLGSLEFQAGDAADSSRAWYTRARGGVQVQG